MPPATDKMNTNELFNAWTNRKTVLHRVHMDKYADILYDRLAGEFATTRDDIQDQMLEAIRTATKRSDLNVRIFTYNTRHGTCDPLFSRASADMLCAINGWHHTVAVEYELRPESLYHIFKSTNICARLAKFFGPNFWVSARPTRKIVAEMSCGYVIKEYELRLSYYPNGLNEYQLHELSFLRERETYVPENRVIWWDDGPRTPPQPVAEPPQPPPLIRLPRGVSIQEHDSPSEAARALFQDCVRECYCYNPDDSE